MKCTVTDMSLTQPWGWDRYVWEATYCLSKKVKDKRIVHLKQKVEVLGMYLTCQCASDSPKLAELTQWRFWGFYYSFPPPTLHHHRPLSCNTIRSSGLQITTFPDWQEMSVWGKRFQNRQQPLTGTGTTGSIWLKCKETIGEKPGR